MTKQGCDFFSAACVCVPDARFGGRRVSAVMGEALGDVEPFYGIDVRPCMCAVRSSILWCYRVYSCVLAAPRRAPLAG